MRHVHTVNGEKNLYNKYINQYQVLKLLLRLKLVLFQLQYYQNFIILRNRS